MRGTTRDRVQDEQLKCLKHLVSKLDALDAKLDTFINLPKNERKPEKNENNECERKEQFKKRRGRKPIILSDEQLGILLDETLTVAEKAERLGVSTGWVSERSKSLRSES